MMSRTRATSPRCWAFSLGDCNGPLTGEHVVSSAVLPRRIRITGLPWATNQDKAIGAASFVANILCRRHNGLLSTIDAEAGRVAAELRSLRSSEPLDRIQLDGPLLERWVLKTAINVLFGQKLRFGREQATLELPPPWLVAIAFGRSRWPPMKGLFLCGFGEATVDFEDSVELSPLLSHTDAVAGALCVFLGLCYLLVWGPEQPTRLGATARSVLQGAQCVFHAGRVDLELPSGNQVEVLIDWQSSRR